MPGSSQPTLKVDLWITLNLFHAELARVLD